MQQLPCVDCTASIDAGFHVIEFIPVKVNHFSGFCFENKTQFSSVWKSTPNTYFLSSKAFAVMLAFGTKKEMLSIVVLLKFFASS